MNVTIQRQPSADQGTAGDLSLDNGFSCATLELPWRDNQHDISSVPSGTYVAKWQFSNHFQTNLYHLQDVPNRANCMIHAGNFAGDTSKGFKSNVEGCILLGMAHGVLKGQTAVISSKIALGHFHDHTKGVDLSVTILDAA